MKTRTWKALAAVLATGFLMLPLTACFQIVKKEEDPKPAEPKKTAVKPAEPGALGR